MLPHIYNIMWKTAGSRREKPACARKKTYYFAVVTSVTVFAMVENTL